MTCWLAVLVPLCGLPGGPGTGPAPAPGPRLVVAAPPRLALSFRPREHWYTMTLRVTTADGKAHSSGPLRIEQHGQAAARDVVFEGLKDAGWAVEKAGTNTLIIWGIKRPDGVTAVKLGTLTIRGDSLAKAALISLGGATAENDVPK